MALGLQQALRATAAAAAVYPLAEAAEAHRALESGRTTGSVLLEL